MMLMIYTALWDTYDAMQYRVFTVAGLEESIFRRAKQLGGNLIP